MEIAVGALQPAAAGGPSCPATEEPRRDRRSTAGTRRRLPPDAEVAETVRENGVAEPKAEAAARVSQNCALAFAIAASSNKS